MKKLSSVVWLTTLVIGTYKDGQLVREYNGLTTLEGTPKAVGWPWEFDDTIKVYSSKQYFIGAQDIKNTITVYQTDDAAAFRQKINSAEMSRQLINAQNLDYALLTQNSNSAAKTMLEAMDIDLLDSQLSNRLTPGRNNLLLDDFTLRDLQAVSDGGSLSPGLSQAYSTIQSIGDTLDRWAVDHGVSLTLGEVLAARGRDGGATLYSKLDMADPTALATMWELEEDLIKLKQISDQFQLGDSFIASVAEYAAEASSALESAASFMSPVVVDLDGDGVETIASLLEGDLFDFGDAAVKAHGWLSGDDGFLVVDSNGNNKIDSYKEMFGGRDLDGFSELAIHDENGDGLISSQDSIFESLLIWRDENENGMTDDGELHDLSSLGVSEFTLSSSLSTDIDKGNLVALRSHATSEDGVSNFETADVYFRTLRDSNAEGTQQVSSAESRVVLGTDQDDLILGSSSDQLFSGGVGSDRFVFDENNGNDIITDFTVNSELESDYIQLEGFNLSDFDDLSPMLEQVGGDAVVNLDNHNSITLIGVQVEALHADHFYFV